MKVICINKLGWYLHDGNFHPFLESGHENEGGIENDQICFVTSMFVDKLGDLIYHIDGYTEGYDADSFVLPVEQEFNLHWNCRCVN